MRCHGGIRSTHRIAYRVATSTHAMFMTAFAPDFTGNAGFALKTEANSTHAKQSLVVLRPNRRQTNHAW